MSMLFDKLPKKEPEIKEASSFQESLAAAKITAQGYLRKAFYTAVAGAAIATSVGAGVEYLQYVHPYEKGDVVGTVFALSQKEEVVPTKIGKFSIPFCTTWEGSVATTGFNGKASGIANTINISIEDENVLKVVEAARVSGTPIELHFEKTHQFFTCFRKSDTLITAAHAKDHSAQISVETVAKPANTFPSPQ
jgi:hypothetical protein